MSHDFFIAQDVGDTDRLAEADYFAAAKRQSASTITSANQSFADENYIHGEISSASEVLFELFNKKNFKGYCNCIYGNDPRQGIPVFLHISGHHEYCR